MESYNFFSLINAIYFFTKKYRLIIIKKMTIDIKILMNNGYVFYLKKKLLKNLSLYLAIIRFFNNPFKELPLEKIYTFVIIIKYLF